MGISPSTLCRPTKCSGPDNGTSNAIHRGRCERRPSRFYDFSLCAEIIVGTRAVDNGLSANID